MESWEKHASHTSSVADLGCVRWRRRFLGKIYASSADALIVHKSKSCLKREEQPLPAAISDHEGRINRDQRLAFREGVGGFKTSMLMIYSNVVWSVYLHSELQKRRTDPAKSANNPGMSHECPEIQSVTSGKAQEQ